jgi:hypothetical protein
MRNNMNVSVPTQYFINENNPKELLDSTYMVNTNRIYLCGGTSHWQPHVSKFRSCPKIVVDATSCRRQPSPYDCRSKLSSVSPRRVIRFKTFPGCEKTHIVMMKTVAAGKLGPQQKASLTNPFRASLSCTLVLLWDRKGQVAAKIWLLGGVTNSDHRTLGAIVIGGISRPSRSCWEIPNAAIVWQ